MFAERRFNNDLVRLIARRQRLEAAFDEEVKNARAIKPVGTKVDEIESRRQWELELIYDEIGVVSSRFWQKQADIFQVAVPNDWISSRQLGETYLSRAATAQIRSDIRIERKAKWEWWQSRVTLVLSIFGSVVALFAYFKK
ncbi:MAG TPA: hypothetical protein VF499_06820 [Afipia sp.]